MESGIYKITNTVVGRVYIGQSYNIKERWRGHVRALNNPNASCNRRLQNAWNKYGEENFKFEVIEYCPIEELNTKEEYWINYYDSSNRDKGYNIMTIASGHSEESRRLISKKKKGVPVGPFSEDHKKRLSEALKGRVQPQDLKDRTSLASGRNRANLEEEKLIEIYHITRAIPFGLQKPYAEFLSKEYFTSYSTVRRIIDGNHWICRLMKEECSDEYKDLFIEKMGRFQNEYNKAKNSIIRTTFPKLNKESLIEIYNLTRDIPKGSRVKYAGNLAEKYNTSIKTVRNIMCDKHPICDEMKIKEEEENAISG